MSAIETAPLSIRPAVLFDIDGTLLIPGITMPQDHNPAHGEWIRGLGELADIYYISTKGPIAHELVGTRLGLPEFDWVDYRPYGDYIDPASRALAITALFAKRPVAWVDDTMGASEYEWAADRNEFHAPTLLIQPEGLLGVQQVHMHEISRWIGGLTDVRAA